MVRTLLGSLAGAAPGLLVVAAVFVHATGAQPSNDGGPLVLFLVGVFLAGTGAIAGAIIGGVADLLEFLRRKERVRRETPDRNE
jgi:hypothetical protein